MKSRLPSGETDLGLPSSPHLGGGPAPSGTHSPRPNPGRETARRESLNQKVKYHPAYHLTRWLTDTGLRWTWTRSSRRSPIQSDGRSSSSSPEATRPSASLPNPTERAHLPSRGTSG